MLIEWVSLRTHVLDSLGFCCVYLLTWQNAQCVDKCMQWNECTIINYLDRENCALTIWFSSSVCKDPKQSLWHLVFHLPTTTARLSVAWMLTNVSLVVYLLIAICLPACQNGRCTAPNNCTCNSGWAGSDCSQRECFILVFVGLTSWSSVLPISLCSHLFSFMSKWRCVHCS